MRRAILICVVISTFGYASAEYTPTTGYAVREIEGWRVLVNGELLSDHAQLTKDVLKLLEFQRYESVLHICGRPRRAYALNNDQEYFAECSEAFLGTNDFYQFVRSELQQRDSKMYELLGRLWNVKLP